LKNDALGSDSQTLKTAMPIINLSSGAIKIQGRLCRIANIDGDGYKFLDSPEPMLSELRKSKLGVDLFTFIPKLSEAATKYPYPMEWDNMAVLPISTFENWWTQQLGFKARNKAKQAEKKGIVVREVPFDDRLIQGIWEIYNECPVRQERLFPHYGKSLEAVRKMSATFLDTSIFMGAFQSDKLVGFIKLTADDSGTQAAIMHIVSLLAYRDKSPTNALIMQAVRSCADRGISSLVYANFAYGKKVRSSLSDFKERNGFQRVDIPRYYVPFSRWGSLAFSLGLHGRLTERVPEPVAAKLRAWRGAWYQHKFQLKAETF
jgi:hypothetical protein